MSYLNLPAGVPNFSRAVFSLWFRVPKAAVLATIQRANTDPALHPLLSDILPLMTFGAPQRNLNYHGEVNVAVYNYPPLVAIPVMAPANISSPFEVDPCLIGAVCYDEGNFDLTFKLQTGTFGLYFNVDWQLVRADLFSPEQNSGYTNQPGAGWGTVGIARAYYTIEDRSDLSSNEQPEVFVVETDLPQRLEPDVWHHLLLSFDVSGSVRVGNPFPSSSCRLWYAIDDVDYRGDGNLMPYRAPTDGLNANAIVTKNCWEFSVPPLELFMNHYIGAPSGGYSGAPIPTSGASFGIPAAPKYVDSIFRVEMGEFQLFSGVTLDTGITGNRRAFVDSKGNPVEPIGTATEKPPAEKLLGKRPDILLHGSDNWQEGLNSGALGVAIDPDTGLETILPSGQFQRTGGIEQFTPDPSLKPAA